jgi:hypothetical protein
VALVFFLLLKLMMIFFSACFLLYFVKRILNDNYQPVPSQSS